MESDVLPDSIFGSNKITAKGKIIPPYIDVLKQKQRGSEAGGEVGFVGWGNWEKGREGKMWSGCIV